MPMFNAKPHHEFICMFNSNKHMNTENDESLYFDTEGKHFFVVETTEYEGGPSVSISHTTRSVSEEEAQKIVSRDPEWETKASQYYCED